MTDIASNSGVRLSYRAMTSVSYTHLFGGLGYNFANPALVGRIVLFLGFTSRMTAYVYPDMAVDALASATPLAVPDKTTLPLLDVFLGFHGGMMGEVCVLAILLGFAYLVATRTIQATIPVTIVATVFVLTALNTGSAYTALIECMSGGLLFGAVFMATDYVTSPFTTKMCIRDRWRSPASSATSSVP